MANIDSPFYFKEYLNIYVRGRNNTKEIKVNVPIQFVRLALALPFISNKIQVTSISEIIKDGKSGDSIVEVNEKEGDYVHIKLL